MRIRSRERKLTLETGDNKLPPTSSTETGAFAVVLVDGRFRVACALKKVKVCWKSR
jgi:hypothetical protein